MSCTDKSDDELQESAAQEASTPPCSTNPGSSGGLDLRVIIAVSLGDWVVSAEGVGTLLTLF